MKEKRKRNWVFVVYPESAPENWREILRDMHVSGFISPLHDSDVNPDGETKKPHWHVILTFKGLQSFEQVKEITDALNAPAPQVCKDIRAYARYLCHLDNPEKAQYSVGDVEALAGADYLEKIACAADTDSALSEMMDFCIEQGIYSFFRLANYARKNRPDWFRVLTSSRTQFLVAWLKSFEWEIKDDFRTHEHHGQHHEHHGQHHEHHGQHHEKRCPECGSDDIMKSGKTAADVQRYQCRECGKKFV